MRTWQHIPFTMSASRQFDLWQEIENEITAAVFYSFFVTHIRLRMRKLWIDLVQGDWERVNESNNDKTTRISGTRDEQTRFWKFVYNGQEGTLVRGRQRLKHFDSICRRIELQISPIELLKYTQDWWAICYVHTWSSMPIVTGHQDDDDEVIPWRALLRLTCWFTYCHSSMFDFPIPLFMHDHYIGNRELAWDETSFIVTVRHKIFPSHSVDFCNN